MMRPGRLAAISPAGGHKPLWCHDRPWREGASSPEDARGPCGARMETRRPVGVRHPPSADLDGTNLLGLVKHNAISDSRYFGDVFGRPFPEPLPRWDDFAVVDTDHWATDGETRAGGVDLYRRVWSHSDATIEALDLDARGYVPWWQEEVPLFKVMVHRLSDATRHAGHADILPEGGSMGPSGLMPTARRCMDVTVPSGRLAAR